MFVLMAVGCAIRPLVAYKNEQIELRFQAGTFSELQFEVDEELISLSFHLLVFEAMAAS